MGPTPRCNDAVGVPPACGDREAMRRSSLTPAGERPRVGDHGRRQRLVIMKRCGGAGRVRHSGRGSGVVSSHLRRCSVGARRDRARSPSDHRGATRRALAQWSPPRHPLPVIGVPVPLAELDGLDSLLSSMQMPAGVPVATVSIGAPVCRTLLAVRMLEPPTPAEGPDRRIPGPAGRRRGGKDAELQRLAGRINPRLT